MRIRIAGIGLATLTVAAVFLVPHGGDKDSPPPAPGTSAETSVPDTVASGAAPNPVSASSDVAPSAGSAEGTTAWLSSKYPQKVRMLFAALNLERPGLEAVGAHVRSGEWADACDALLRYYREGDSGGWLRREPPAHRPGRYPIADQAMADTINVLYVPAKIPRHPDGGIDWNFRGPSDTFEYQTQFNALIHVRHLYGGYLALGDAKYVRRMDADIRDWILANPYPGPGAEGTPWQGHWSSARIQDFARWFYALLDEPAFTDATRLLMLTSVVEQGDLLRGNHYEFGNHLIGEMTGLATAGAAWPELLLADEWIDYATGIMRREVDRQVYPDGVQFELTSHYHAIVAGLYEDFMALLGHAGRESAELRPAVEKMWDYLAYSMRPDGIGPMNNDSYEHFDRQRILELAPSYGRDDWLYIATGGSRGSAPQRGPSVFYPWAGQVVMRSGWDADALWAYFEFGPAGKAHWHWDKLHVSVFAFGRPLLVDNGLFHYADDEWWRYFRGTTAHNVILVDGRGQKLWEETADAPLDPSHWRPGPEVETAWGTMRAFDGVQGNAVHHRAVTYVRGRYWVVVDRIETDRPRDVTALWHFHPDCAVVLDGVDAVSVDAGVGNLRIAPAGPVAWSPRRERASRPPDPIQGWYSPLPNKKLPATVVVYDGHIEGTTTFAWVLFPARGLVPRVFVEITADGRIDVDTPTDKRTLATGLDTP